MGCLTLRVDQILGIVGWGASQILVTELKLIEFRNAMYTYEVIIQFFFLKLKFWMQMKRREDTTSLFIPMFCTMFPILRRKWEEHAYLFWYWKEFTFMYSLLAIWDNMKISITLRLELLFWTKWNCIIINNSVDVLACEY